LGFCEAVERCAVVAADERQRQAEAAVLVDHIQELESAAISCGVELEVHGPHLVGMLGTVTPH
jgi:hypothetical protein